MELPYLLMQQTLIFFLIIVMGIIATKYKVVSLNDSKVLTSLILYVITPCVIICSYQREISQELATGLAYSLGAAVICHIFFIILAWILKKFFSLTSVERTNLIYTNSGNFTIPLVAAVMGNDSVMYTSTFLAVQTFLIWTHGVTLVSGTKGNKWRNILLNVNVIAIFVGVLFFLFKIKLPVILYTAMYDVGSMIGTVSMFVIGVILGNTDVRALLNLKAILISLLRLILFPVLLILVFKYSGYSDLYKSKDAFNILLISFIAASAPTAVMVTQFAFLFNKDFKYSSIVNVYSVISCIITMPFMVWCFTKLI